MAISLHNLQHDYQYPVKECSPVDGQPTKPVIHNKIPPQHMATQTKTVCHSNDRAFYLQKNAHAHAKL